MRNGDAVIGTLFRAPLGEITSMVAIVGAGDVDVMEYRNSNTEASVGHLFAKGKCPARALPLSERDAIAKSLFEPELGT
jgi:hypothetical protein